MDGKILKTPVNGELLKKYYSRENFEPFVVVWFWWDSKFLEGDICDGIKSTGILECRIYYYNIRDPKGYINEQVYR